jgi:hypothetical protein
MKLRLFGVLAVAMLAVGVNASIAAGGGSIGDVVVTPKSGPVGTTVHVIIDNCGEQITGLSPQGVVSVGGYVPGTGRILVHVDGWPAPFSDAFGGGVNNQFGVAVATFQVPDVDPGVYTLEVECVALCGSGVHSNVSCATVEPAAFGGYTPTDFTVTAPSAPGEAEAPAAVTAGATTTG